MAGHRVGVAVTVAAMALVVTGCTSGSGRAPSASSARSGSGAPTPFAPSKALTGVKPVIRGLIDRQGEPPTSMLSVVHAFVVKVNWSDLQPTPFGPIVGDNAIDKALARVRQPDFVAAGMTLKLRVLAGVAAPEWAKELGGSPIRYVNTQEGGSVPGGTIGRFWSTDFGRAYADVETKLAARYDDVPEIREVTVSRCSTIFDELFVRQPGDEGNVSGMLSAGYTAAADRSCIEDAIKAHAVWKHTTSDVAFSPFPNVADPAAAPDLAFTQYVMTLCRSTLGARCGLQNNALSTSKLANPRFEQLYATMTRLGPPIVLQTAARSRLGDPEQVLRAAAEIGACSVELPAGYPRWPRSLLESAQRALAENPLPSG